MHIISFPIFLKNHIEKVLGILADTVKGIRQSGQHWKLGWAFAEILTYHESLGYTAIHGVTGACALHKRVCSKITAKGANAWSPLTALAVRFTAAGGGRL